MKILKALLVSGSLMVTFAAGNAQAILIIDNFDSIQTASATGLPVGPKSATSQGGPDVLGGQRDIFVERISNNAGSVDVDTSLSLPSVLAMSTGVGTIGRTGLVFDGVDGSAAFPLGISLGLGSVDLTQGGNNVGILIRATSDLGALLRLNFFTDALTNISTFLVAIPADPTFVFVDLFIPFASFMVASGTGADFTNIDAISVFINAGNQPATDVAIDLIGAVGVPEPGTLALLGMGFIAISRLRRRSKKVA